MGHKVNKDEIRWVITVPAIWRPQAKQFMREAAYEVNMEGKVHDLGFDCDLPMQYMYYEESLQCNLS